MVATESGEMKTEEVSTQVETLQSGRVFSNPLRNGNQCSFEVVRYYSPSTETATIAAVSTSL